MSKLDTVKDSFVAGPLNTLVWTDHLGDSWDSGAGGRTALNCNTAYSYISLGAVAPGVAYDLTASYIFAKFLLPAMGNGTKEHFLDISRFGTWGATRDGVSLYITGTNLGAFRKLAGATSGQMTSIPYDAVNHAWLRVREAGGTIFCDTSPDSQTWTNRWSVASGFDTTQVYAALTSGYYGTEAASTTYIDEVNVAASTNPIRSVV